VPTDSEWQTLVIYLGDSTVAGGKMKETGTTHWCGPNASATNESGFTALPGGFRQVYGYYHMGNVAPFWSSTEHFSYNAWYRYLSCIDDYSGVYRNDAGKAGNGFAIRCVKDE
jgi:uncharacterized protein (TIGR02145 family)